MPVKKMSLNDWIEKVGSIEVAKLLKINPSTVRHWRRGFCLPKTDQMRKIKRLSKGAVTCDDMIEAFYSSSSAKRNA